MTHIQRRLTLGLIAALIAIGGIGFALSQSISSTSDVRIVAQKLEDGRIEFALEQDGERVLPRSRFFPADAPVGRWLKSTPIAVDVEPAVATMETPYLSLSGSGDDYRSAGHFSAGHYICSVSVSGNDDEYGGDNFSVVSYGFDGSYGGLHANEIESSWSGRAKLVVGDGWSADVPVGKVWFEVNAAPKGQWTISCSLAN